MKTKDDVITAVLTSKLVRFLLRLTGNYVWVEWETQTTEPDGCFRTWQNGFGSLSDAIASMEQDSAAGKKWNPLMDKANVKWRVGRQISVSRYYPINSVSR